MTYINAGREATGMAWGLYFEDKSSEDAIRNLTQITNLVDVRWINPDLQVYDIAPFWYDVIISMEDILPFVSGPKIEYMAGIEMTFHGGSIWVRTNRLLLFTSKGFYQVDHLAPSSSSSLRLLVTITRRKLASVDPINPSSSFKRQVTTAWGSDSRKKPLSHGCATTYSHLLDCIWERLVTEVLDTQSFSYRITCIYYTFIRGTGMDSSVQDGSLVLKSGLLPY